MDGRSREFQVGSLILVDSSVWIDYFNGMVNRETDLLDDALQTDMIIVGDIILTEVLQGFFRDRDYYTARELLLRLPFMPMIGKELALQSAALYRKLRKIGVTPRKTIDVFITAFCLHHHLPLLHRDRDFDVFAEHLGLQVV